ncbi:MAG TPA: ATP-binding protein [Bryobacteraceae bacterium]|nr:ATP-binding protein [Bryobacteraceae bacterium]
MLAAATWLFPGHGKAYRIGYANFPPLMVTGGDIPGGFAVNVVREAAQRRGITIEWVPLEGAPDAALANGTIDLYPLLADAPDRRQRLHLSYPWWEANLVLIVDRRSGLQRADQMEKRRLAFVSPSISAALAQKLFPRSEYVRKLPYEDVLRAACTGEADAAFLTIGLYLELLQQRVHGCEDVSLAPIVVPEASIAYSVGAGKGAASVADEIAAEIGIFAYDGTLGKIGARSGVLVSNQAQLIRSLSSARRNRNIWIVIASVLALLTLMALWQNQRVREARKVAERARKAEAEFLAHVSHEIRTPMNGVLGMLGLALETNPNPEMQEYLETANHSALALMSVLNDILDFSKIDAGRLELEDVEFSPAQVIEQCVKTLSPESRRKGLSLVAEVSRDMPAMCVGDPNRLRQVILNLIGNALKFTERGGVTIKAEVGRLGSTDAALHFEVRDTGIGIPRAKQESIFHAFSQADRSTTRKFGGTGLGLAIASRLVELMNGTIWVQSEPDQGSAFHFTVVLGRVASPQTGFAPVKVELGS